MVDTDVQYYLRCINPLQVDQGEKPKFAIVIVKSSPASNENEDQSASLESRSQTVCTNGTANERTRKQIGTSRVTRSNASSVNSESEQINKEDQGNSGLEENKEDPLKKNFSFLNSKSLLHAKFLKNRVQNGRQQKTASTRNKDIRAKCCKRAGETQMGRTRLQTEFNKAGLLKNCLRNSRFSHLNGVGGSLTNKRFKSKSLILKCIKEHCNCYKDEIEPVKKGFKRHVEPRCVRNGSRQAFPRTDCEPKQKKKRCRREILNVTSSSTGVLKASNSSLPEIIKSSENAKTSAGECSQSSLCVNSNASLLAKKSESAANSKVDDNKQESSSSFTTVSCVSRKAKKNTKRLRSLRSESNGDLLANSSSLPAVVTSSQNLVTNCTNEPNTGICSLGSLSVTSSAVFVSEKSGNAETLLSIASSKLDDNEHKGISSSTSASCLPQQTVERQNTEKLCSAPDVLHVTRNSKKKSKVLKKIHSETNTVSISNNSSSSDAVTSKRNSELNCINNLVTGKCSEGLLSTNSNTPVVTGKSGNTKTLSSNPTSNMDNNPREDSPTSTSSFSLFQRTEERQNTKNGSDISHVSRKAENEPKDAKRLKKFHSEVPVSNYSALPEMVTTKRNTETNCINESDSSKCGQGSLSTSSNSANSKDNDNENQSSSLSRTACRSPQQKEERQTIKELCCGKDISHVSRKTETKTKERKKLKRFRSEICRDPISNDSSLPEMVMTNQKTEINIFREINPEEHCQGPVSTSNGALANKKSCNVVTQSSNVNSKTDDNEHDSSQSSTTSSHLPREMEESQNIKNVCSGLETVNILHKTGNKTKKPKKAKRFCAESCGEIPNNLPPAEVVQTLGASMPRLEHLVNQLSDMKAKKDDQLVPCSPVFVGPKAVEGPSGTNAGSLWQTESNFDLSEEVLGQGYLLGGKFKYRILRGVPKALLPPDCVCCRQRMGSHVQLKEHLRAAHPYRCIPCASSFDSFVDLEVHRTVVHNKERHKCGWCNQIFSSNSRYEQHCKSYLHLHIVHQVEQGVRTVLKDFFSCESGSTLPPEFRFKETKFSKFWHEKLPDDNKMVVVHELSSLQCIKDLLKDQDISDSASFISKFEKMLSAVRQYESSMGVCDGSAPSSSGSDVSKQRPVVAIVGPTVRSPKCSQTASVAANFVMTPFVCPTTLPKALQHYSTQGSDSLLFKCENMTPPSSGHDEADKVNNCFNSLDFLDDVRFKSTTCYTPSTSSSDKTVLWVSEIDRPNSQCFQLPHMTSLCTPLNLNVNSPSQNKVDSATTPLSCCMDDCNGFMGAANSVSLQSGTSLEIFRKEFDNMWDQYNTFSSKF